MIELKPATAELLKGYKTPVHVTIRGLVAVDGDEVAGFAGIYRREDGLIMFAELGPKVIANPRLMVRAYRKLLDWVREARMPVRSLADENIPKSAQFLEHLGFRQVRGNIYEWVP